MKLKIAIYLSLLFICLACQNVAVDSSNSIAQLSEGGNIKAENVQAQEDEDEKIWIPSIIQKCISKLSFGEPVEMATSFNPYYLRADFDGNNAIDYAVLVKGKNTKQNGLIICKDSKDPFVFGAISRSKGLSSFEDDNFITDNWDINTKEETKKAALDPAGKSRIGSKAKGESIGFYFDGGSLFIYWNGESFQIVEGG
jgi:hypothetical protein